jgi:hypothetical protein
MNPTHITLAAVAALAAAGAVGRRGSRTQLDLPLNEVWLSENNIKHKPPSTGERVKVYFNLNAQYNKQYGQLREPPTDEQIQEFMERRKCQIVLAEHEGKCLPTRPNESQIRGMYASGAVYSVQAYRDRRWLVSAHARAVAIHDVVFTTSGTKIKEIRNKRSKDPCCFGDGYLMSHGEAAKRLLQRRLNEPHAIVGINPMRNDTFVVMAPETSDMEPGDEVFTADLAIFTDNPNPRVGSPPGLVYAFGINQGHHRRGKLVKANCKPTDISGVIRP